MILSVNICKSCGKPEDSVGLTTENECADCSYNSAIKAFNEKYSYSHLDEFGEA